MFSVVVATCNRPELLARCLEELVPERQKLTREKYEVIVSDDGALRSAESLVTERFPWARWVCGPRRGAAANRNCGAAVAQGEWLAFTDDDCVPAPGWLAAFAAAAQATPDLAVLEGRTTSGPVAMGALEIAPVNESGGYLWSCNFAIRAEAFRGVGGFDEWLGSDLEDVDLRVRLGRAGLRTEFVPSATVMHPPRPLRPIVRQVLGHKTYFQFARKHGVSLRDAGLSWRPYAVWRWQILRRSRDAGEVARFALRCLAEAVLLLPLCLWWSATVRAKK